MATTVRTRTTTRTQKKRNLFSFPLEKTNLYIIGVGIALLIFGYILMSQNSVDGFLPTVVAPILLVLGYCVVIPYGILKRFNLPEKTDIEETRVVKESVVEEKPNVKTTSKSPNVKTSSNIKTGKR